MISLNFAIEKTQEFEDKKISVQEWIVSLLGEDYRNIYSDEYCRRAEKIFSLFINKLSEENLKDINYNELDIINEKEANLKREKEKIKQEKNQLAETYRWQARNELFQEKIINAIKNLPDLQVKDLKFDNNVKLNCFSQNTTALLCLSDFHAGSTFEIKGAFGETINKYSFDIMKDRMYNLLKKISKDALVCDDMVVAILGDAFENILRMSSLTKLREPVLDTVIKFSEFLSLWIVDLYNEIKVPIKIVCVGGNHDVQRLLGEKPNLEEENLMKIVVEFLKLRLEKYDFIKVANYTDTAIENIRGSSILFQHGEDKDLSTTINYFENLYNIELNEIYSGHLHHPENKTIGISNYGDRQINRIGSISGVDPFAKKSRVAARPSAYIALYSEEGKGWNKTIYL